MPPETRYAKSGETNIAYQVTGSRAVDLVFVIGWASNLEGSWQEPSFARFLKRLASFSRLILFDKRGTGFSDRRRFGHLRATHGRCASRDGCGGIRTCCPSRHFRGGSYVRLVCSHLSPARHSSHLDRRLRQTVLGTRLPMGATHEECRSFLGQIERGWGGPVALARRAPSLAADEHFRQWWATFLRMSASPAAASTLTRMNTEIDIRHILPMLHVPTLIIHRTDDLAIRVECSRHLAEQIADSRYVELPGRDHLPFVGDQDAILDEIQHFLTGARPVRAAERILATVLITEIRGATETAIRLHESWWRAIRDTYAALVRQELPEYHGREVKTTYLGVLATFETPVRAIQCACAIAAALDLPGSMLPPACTWESVRSWEMSSGRRGAIGSEHHGACRTWDCRCLSDGEGPGGRFGYSVPGSRRIPSQGQHRRVAPVSGR